MATELHAAMIVVILVGLMATVTVSWTPTSFTSEDYKKLYPMLKILEDSLISDPEQLYVMKQTFFPVITSQFWSMDGLEVIKIIACLNFTTDGNFSSTSEPLTFKTEESKDISKCWILKWTNSKLMSIISGDQMLAMDPVLFSILYSDMVGSLVRGRNLGLHFLIPLAAASNDPSVTPTDNEILYTLGLLLSWAKAYAAAGGVPQQWESQYQGYITVWYSYYGAESFFASIIRSDNNVYISLWLTFAIINILVPLLLFRRGIQLSKAVSRASDTHKAFSAIFKAIFATIIICNMLYIAAMLTLHIHYGWPTLLSRKPQALANTNDFVHGTLVTKTVLFILGTIIELLAAINITRQIMRANSTCYKCLCFLGLLFITWQCLIFIHIVLGVISIPFIIALIISPGHSILATGSMISLLGTLTVAIASIIHTKPWNIIFCKSNIGLLFENLIISIFLFAVLATYFVVIKAGVNMSTMKGVLLTLLPTLPLPVITWIVRRKLNHAAARQSQPAPLKRVIEFPNQLCFEDSKEEVEKLVCD